MLRAQGTISPKSKLTNNKSIKKSAQKKTTTKPLLQRYKKSTTKSITSTTSITTTSTSTFSTRRDGPGDNNAALQEQHKQRAQQMAAEDQMLHVVSPELIFGNSPFMTPSSTGISVARYYTNVNATKPREHWDYEHHRVLYHSPDNYDAYRKLGRGKYSEVFAGIKLSTEEPVIIKILKPVKKKKIRREILALQHLIGMPYCTQLLNVLKDPINRTTVLITRFNEAEDFKTLFPKLTDEDVRIYTYQLLWALDHAHSQGVMHRDVKPQNVVIDTQHRVLRLIDWGLAEFYHPNTEYNTRVASRYFKGPELLLNMRDYDYSTDLWSLGATFAGMIFVVHPFFNGADNLDMINKQARIMGSADFHRYMERYQIKDPDGEFKRLIGNYQKKGFDLFVNNVNKHLATDDALDLLSKMLVVDHNERISAREAMAHPYFDPVREFVQAQHKQLSAQLKEEIEYRNKVDQKFKAFNASDDEDF